MMRESKSVTESAILNKSGVAVSLVLALLISSCVTFIAKPDEARLRELERQTYVLLKGAEAGGKSLKKGEEVKILISSGKEWVKVHAYPARADLLKTDRFLILYLFDEEFNQKQFEMKFFEERLKTVVLPKGTPLPDDRDAAKKKDKKIKKKK